MGMDNMKTVIEVGRDAIIIFPNKKEEKIVNTIVRGYFKSAGFPTDRCWSDWQKKTKRPLGIRIYYNRAGKKEKLYNKAMADFKGAGIKI